MKRIICLSLALLMLVLACPLSAIAATTPAVVIKDSNGDVPSATAAFTTINDAFDWVYSQDNSEEYTIYLNDDVSTTKVLKAFSYDNTNVKTVKIDGQGHTLTGTDTSYDAVFYGLGLYNLKLSNIKISQVKNAHGVEITKITYNVERAGVTAKQTIFVVPCGDRNYVVNVTISKNVTGLVDTVFNSLVPKK